MMKSVPLPIFTIEDLKLKPCVPPTQKTMPIFPTGVSALPHSIARSALFSPIKRGRRSYRDNEVIASRGDVFISYTGKQLDMGDSDIFLQSIIAMQGRPVEDVIIFHRAEFLAAIGRGKGKSQYLWLDEGFKRLMGAFLTVKSDKYECSFQILNEYGRNKETGDFYLKINPESIKLFNYYGHIDMKKRNHLELPLSKWLQGYISSHKKGRHKISIERLHNWCGSTQELRFWKAKNLKPAIQELEKLEIISATRMTTETVEWRRK